MQWTNTTARRDLCEVVFKKLSNRKRFEDFKEVFQRYLTTWKDQVTFVEKASDHFHGLGCHFLQSAIGLTFSFKKWSFNSWIEYKVKPLKIEELPCPCIWNEKCSVLSNCDKLQECIFLSKGQRRFDLCWIEESLLDNIVITAEVETSSVIKSDLTKLYSIFVKSTPRNKRGFNNPILHIQLDISGKNFQEIIKKFMRKHLSYTLSPSIIYINHEEKFGKWNITWLQKGEPIEKKTF